MHGSPPFLAFVMIDLDFCFRPVPQDLEHELHSLQADHWQLTEMQCYSRSGNPKIKRMN